MRKLTVCAVKALAMLWLALGIAGAAFAQSYNIRDYPSVEKIRSTIKGSNAEDTAARQIVVLFDLANSIAHLQGKVVPNHEMPKADVELAVAYRAVAMDMGHERGGLGLMRPFGKLVSGYQRNAAFLEESRRALLPEALRRTLVQQGAKYEADWSQKQLEQQLATQKQKEEETARIAERRQEQAARLAREELIIETIQYWGGIALSLVLYGLAFLMLLPRLAAVSSLRKDGARLLLSLGGKTFNLIPTAGVMTSMKDWQKQTVSGSAQQGVSTTSWREQEFTVIDQNGRKHPFHAVDRGLQADPGDRLTVFQLQRSRWTWFLGIYNHESARFFGTQACLGGLLNTGFFFNAAMVLGLLSGLIGAFTVWLSINDTIGWGVAGGIAGGIAVAVVLFALFLYIVKNRKIDAEGERIREKLLRPLLAERGEPSRMAGGQMSDDEIVLPNGTVLRRGD